MVIVLQKDTHVQTQKTPQTIGCEMEFSRVCFYVCACICFRPNDPNNIQTV